MILNFFAYFSTAWFILLIANTLRYLRKVKFLRDVPLTEPHFEWPRISLIAAACNEEHTISAAAAKLLEIDYPNLQLVLVNDRSLDRTGAIIDGLAAKIRVRQIHSACRHSHGRDR